MSDPANSRWLLLIHQLPPKPSYLRVKVWRRLQGLGAVALKNSVYVLPSGDQTREDFEWVVREIEKEGGEASLCEARFIEGILDDQVEALFTAARDADYAAIAEDARRCSDSIPSAQKLSVDARARLEGEVSRLRRRFAEVAAIDFFGSAGRQVAEGLLAGAEARIRGAPIGKGKVPALRPEELRGRTWVTRKGIHVDRIACAWLIRRFVDRSARFKFVAGKGYRPSKRELRFDMFEAEFTHEGDRCTFEVLLARLRLVDPALQSLAEIVHEIDLKDTKFDRPETAGIARLIAGIAMANDEDEERLARGGAVFDSLYEYFRRKTK